MPSPWAASRASAISIVRDRTVSISIGRPAMRCFSVRPSRNSMAMKAWPSWSDIVDRADVGMVQGGSGLGLALEAGKRLRVAGNFLRQEFEGDEAVQARVLGFVYDAHAAAAEFFYDAVVRNGLADHSGDESSSGRFIVRTRHRGVNEACGAWRASRAGMPRRFSLNQCG